MTALKDRFWAKVVFKEFIRHYRKMTAEQKAADVDASMDALEDLDDSGACFGSKMVRWSMERIELYPKAQENGKKGGRPRKDTTADGDIREAPDESTTVSTNMPRVGQNGTHPRNQGGGRAVPAVRPESGTVYAQSSTPRIPAPRDKYEVMDFAEDNGLYVEDARLWYQRNYVERPGCDKDGEVIRNWRGALINACKAEASKRSESA